MGSRFGLVWFGLDFLGGFLLVFILMNPLPGGGL